MERLWGSCVHISGWGQQEKGKDWLFESVHELLLGMWKRIGGMVLPIILIFFIFGVLPQLILFGQSGDPPQLLLLLDVASFPSRFHHCNTSHKLCTETQRQGCKRLLVKSYSILINKINLKLTSWREPLKFAWLWWKWNAEKFQIIILI